MLAREQLLEIVPGVPHATAEAHAAAISEAARLARMDTVITLAAFLAQVAHESDSLRALEEYASGDEYENRLDLGNLRVGDGRRFKGRGLLMITGRAMYHVAGRALGLDLELQPELAAKPEHAAQVAAWVWTTGAGLRLSKAARAYLLGRYGDGPLNLNRVAEARDFLGCTFAINGAATVGAPSYHELRLEFYHRGLEVLGATARVAA